MDLDLVTLASFVAALVVAAGVTYAGELRFLPRNPRSHILSAASGAALAYVFLSLLPKLTEAQSKVAGEAEDQVPFLSQHAFLLALVGTVAFYGLTVLAHATRRTREHEDTDAEVSSPWVFWPTIAMCVLYLGLIGELLYSTASKSLAGLAVVAPTLAFHFAGSDFGLAEHHSRHRLLQARWILGAATIAGWLSGALDLVPSEPEGLLTAFLVGAILVTVFKDEVPSEGDARFVPLAGGALVTGVLLSMWA